jgi:hypothetical protein
MSYKLDARLSLDPGRRFGRLSGALVEGHATAWNARRPQEPETSSGAGAESVASAPTSEMLAGCGCQRVFLPQRHDCA